MLSQAANNVETIKIEIIGCQTGGNLTPINLKKHEWERSKEILFEGLKHEECDLHLFSGCDPEGLTYPLYWTMEYSGQALTIQTISIPSTTHTH